MYCPALYKVQPCCSVYALYCCTIKLEDSQPKYSWTSSARRILFKLMKVTMTSQSKYCSANPNKEKPLQLSTSRVRHSIQILKYNQHQEKVRTINDDVNPSIPAIVPVQHPTVSGLQQIRVLQGSGDPQRSPSIRPGILFLTKC